MRWGTCCCIAVAALLLVSYTITSFWSCGVIGMTQQYGRVHITGISEDEVWTHPLCVDPSNRFALLVRHTKLGEVGPCFQGTARVRVMTTENKVTLSCWSVTILSASDYVGPATGPPLGLAHFVQYVPRGKSHRKKKTVIRVLMLSGTYPSKHQFTTHCCFCETNQTMVIVDGHCISRRLVSPEPVQRMLQREQTID